MSFNNSSHRIGNATSAFATWFTHGLTTLIEIVIGVLLVGGIINYVFVGRKRGEWTPDQAEGLRGARPPGEPPSSPPPPLGPGSS